MDISYGLRRVISVLICLQLVFPFHLPVAPAERAVVLLPPAAFKLPSTSRNPVAQALADPLLETLSEWPQVPFELGFGPSDTTVDADPFFLRSQKWVSRASELNQSPSNPGEFAWQDLQNRVWIQRQDSSSLNLEISAPLRPIYFDGDYVYLAARSASFFDRTSDSSQDRGEGLFLISGDEWAQNEDRGNPVPIYFLPLPGSGWAESPEVLDFRSATGRLAFINARGESLPFDPKDIDQVLSVSRMNLVLAAGSGLRSKYLQSQDAATALPPSGSTAGFGLLFTGFDSDYEPAALFEYARSQTLFPTSFKKVFSFFYREARADELSDANTKLIQQLIRVGCVVGITTVAAVVFKYTVLRDYFRAKDEKLPKPGPLRRVGREVKHIADVLAHNLTTVSQFANIWFGSGVEFIIDRYFSKFGSSKHSLIRRFLEKTVYFSRTTNERLPVNHRTLVLGVLVLGGIDSLLLYFQLYWFVPWVTAQIAVQLPGVARALASQFDLNNPVMEELVRNETVRNGAHYLTAGASKLSGDMRSQYYNVVGPEIDLEMRKEGLDPYDPVNATDRKERMDRRLAEIQKQMGLPGSEDFIFDAGTLLHHALGLFGYASPKEFLAKSEDEIVGESRPGLVLPALKGALTEARKRLKAYPSDQALNESVQLLEETFRRSKSLMNIVRYPVTWILAKSRGRAPPTLTDVVQDFRKVRQGLLALTYDGSFSADVKNLPGFWLEKASGPAAQLAGNFFRRAYFGLLEDDLEHLSGPNRSTSERALGHYGEAESQAKSLLKQRYFDEWNELLEKTSQDEGLASEILHSRHAGEFSLLFDDAIFESARSLRQESNPYKLPPKGFFKAWQERRIQRRSVVTYYQKYGQHFESAVATENETKQWLSVFSSEMMREVGLYPDYDAVPELQNRVETKASNLLEAQLADPKMQEFLGGLRSEDRIQFISTLYAQSAADAYIEFTYDADPKSVPALSTAQPGRFQWLRQTKWVRSSRFLTRCVRTVEAFLPVEAHRLGLLWSIGRVVPVIGYDFGLANLRMLRNLITWCTAGYWFNYVLWGVALPPSLFLVTSLTWFTVYVPTQILTRFFRMQGLEPMGQFRLMVLYAIIYSWATFWGVLIDIPLEKPLRDLLDSIVDGVQDGAVHTAETSAKFLHDCAVWLSQKTEFH